MKLVRLLAVGEVDDELLRGLQRAIPRRLPVSCERLHLALDASTCYHPERQQHHSSEILKLMQTCSEADGGRVIGIAGVDLYIPILKYVFGEAQVQGPCAVVSYYRLRQEFYGLPADKNLLHQRLLKEALHELGHTFGLRHCQDYRCVMASAHAVEWIDLRESEVCALCKVQVETTLSAGMR
jgi:archaemetzincin